MPCRSFNLKSFDATCEFAHVASKLQLTIEPVALMPAVRHHRQRDRRSNNLGYEVRVQGALEHVASGKYTSLREAAQKEGVSHHYLFFHIDSSHIASKISRYTLSDRAENRHVSFTESSQRRQMLAPEEEQVLLDWC